MSTRLHDFDGSQESANVFRQIARAGAWAGITDNDALEEKLQSRLKRIVQCTASGVFACVLADVPTGGHRTVGICFSGAKADSIASTANHCCYSNCAPHGGA